MDRTNRTGYNPLARLASVVLVLSCFLAAPGALAQESSQESSNNRAPLEMTFVDATPQESAAIHDKLRTIISNSDDIAFTDPETFLFSAQKFDVSLDDLGSANQRKAKKELLRRAMRANDLEALVVYKRTGDTLHLIVMGPNGAELKHFESPVKRSQITDKQAVLVLKRLFKVLVPKVQEFRKKKATQKSTSSTTETADQVQSPSEKNLEEGAQQQGDKSDSSKTSESPFGSNVTLTVSPMAGRRALTMNSSARNSVLTHTTPFLGGGMRVESIFGVLPSKSAALGATLSGQYGRFSSKFKTPDEETFTVQGTYFRVGGGIEFLGGLSPNFALFGRVGGQGADVGLETNSIYVGSSYFGVSGGAGFLYRFGEIARLRLGGDVVPTLDTTTNDRAFGESEITLGYGGDFQFDIYATKPLIISAYYIFDLYQPKHNNPNQYEGPATGIDMYHVGGLSLGYQF